MSNKFSDVTVKIDIVATTGSLGFGYPLILATKQEVDIPYTKCADINEVAEVMKTAYATLLAAEKAKGDAGNPAKYDHTKMDIYKTAQLMFMQNHPPAEIAICASTGVALTVGETIGALDSVVEKDWRQLICIIGNGDTATELDIATYIEAQKYKMYFVTVDDVADTSMAKQIYNKGYDRTVLFYYNKLDDSDVAVEPYAVAALLGEVAGQEVGSFTYKNLILKGIDALDITSAELAEIQEVNAITIVEKCGDNVTTDGKCVSGEYIDIIDSVDFVISQMEYRVQKLLTKAPKIPYTNAGIANIESQIVGVLEKAYRNGIIADDEGLPLYSTNFKKREEMSAEDRANRIYTGGKFSFKVAGAIHTAEINGEMII